MPTTFGGRWQVQRNLSEGGQAWTYVVNDLTDAESGDFVLKKLKNVHRIERFRREVAALSRLDHENVARIVDFQLEADDAYLVMPYYAGGSLADAEPFRDRDIGGLLDLFGQICDGVAQAHGAGVFHRDLKPQNVFLFGDRHGNAVVGDFGLCLLEDEPRVTGTLEAVGPRLYMAPELEDGRLENCTRESDVYSLGKLLYWLLSSGNMFSREKHRERRFDLVTVTQNPLLEHVNGRLLDKMIQESPSDRFSLVDAVRMQVVTVKHLVTGGYTVVGGVYDPVTNVVPMPCRHCGLGSYQQQPRDETHAFRSSLPEDWVFVVCNFCGHIEAFRPDLARKAKKPKEWPCSIGHDHSDCLVCGVPAVPMDDRVCERCGTVADL